MQILLKKPRNYPCKVVNQKVLKIYELKNRANQDH